MAGDETAYLRHQCVSEVCEELMISILQHKKRLCDSGRFHWSVGVKIPLYY